MRSEFVLMQFERDNTQTVHLNKRLILNGKKYIYYTEVADIFNSINDENI